MNLKQSTTVLVAGLGLAVLFTLLASPGNAQVKQGKSRPAKTSHLMKGIIKPHCNAVKDQLKEGPGNDEAWDELVMHAALLNETRYALMEDGRCPDGVWADAATKALRQGSADLIKAGQAKSLEAIRTRGCSRSKTRLPRRNARARPKTVSDSIQLEGN